MDARAVTGRRAQLPVGMTTECRPAQGRMGPMGGERWLRWLPFGLLGLASLVVVVTSSEMDDVAADVPLTLGVAGLTAVWMLVTPSPGPANYVGRTALAFVLCWLNPLYAIFGFFGFIDAWDALRRPWVHLGVLVVAITQAGSAVRRAASQERRPGRALPRPRAGQRRPRQRLHEDRAAHRGAQPAARAAQRRPRGRAGGEPGAARPTRGPGPRARRPGGAARLAREIHDTLAQGLAGIVTQLEASVGGETAGAAPLAARPAGLAEARRSVHDLSPGALDGTALPDALAGRWRRWSSEHGVRAEVVVTGDPAPLHPEVEVTVLRIAQEALTNVAKHAGAGRVGLTLSYMATRWCSTCATTASASTSTYRTGPTSFGLRGMRQRVDRLAGDLVARVRARRRHGRLGARAGAGEGGGMITVADRRSSTTTPSCATGCAACSPATGLRGGRRGRRRRRGVDAGARARARTWC